MLAAHKSRYTGIPCGKVWAEHQVSGRIGAIMIYTAVLQTFRDWKKLTRRESALVQCGPESQAMWLPSFPQRTTNFRE